MHAQPGSDGWGDLRQRALRCRVLRVESLLPELRGDVRVETDVGQESGTVRRSTPRADDAPQTDGIGLALVHETFARRADLVNVGAVDVELGREDLVEPVVDERAERESDCAESARHSLRKRTWPDERPKA